MDAKTIAGYLYRFTAGDEAALKRALEDRMRIARQLAAGEEPTGYRVDFVRSSAMKVIDLLGDLGEEFDNKYKGLDRCTPLDLIDILQTCINNIRRAIS